MSDTKTIVIVRTCETSRGKITVEIPGGTKDSDPMEFPIAEALDLIALGVAREPPPYLLETLNQEK